MESGASHKNAILPQDAVPDYVSGTASTEWKISQVMSVLHYESQKLSIYFYPVGLRSDVKFLFTKC